MSNHLINDTELALRSARQLQERFESDPYRPRYHFLPPGGWLNDPNGALVAPNRLGRKAALPPARLQSITCRTRSWCPPS